MHKKEHYVSAYYNDINIAQTYKKLRKNMLQIDTELPCIAATKNTSKAFIFDITHDIRFLEYFVGNTSKKPPF